MSSISGSLQRVSLGTAKTFEHLSSNFAFRVAGDGNVEQPLVDQFQPSDNIADSIQDRRLKQYVMAESAFALPENAVADEKDGEKKLKQVAKDTLGEGWEVEEFYPRGNKTASRTVVSFRSAQGATQKIDIEHRSSDPVLSVRTNASLDGWSVNHSIDVELHNGHIVGDSASESAYLSRG